LPLTSNPRPQNLSNVKSSIRLAIYAVACPHNNWCSPSYICCLQKKITVAEKRKQYLLLYVDQWNRSYQVPVDAEP
jgi:hypothetical protein